MKNTRKVSLTENCDEDDNNNKKRKIDPLVKNENSQIGERYYHIGLEHEENARRMIDDGNESINLAIVNYELAIAKGNTSAMCNLARLYVEGVNLGVECNIDVAIDLYSKASDFHAMYKLANSSHHISMKNRLELIKKSAAGGNLKAMTELGVIYFTSSYGSEPNYAKAFQLFNEAANKGHGRTFGELASLYCHGIYVEKDRKKEVELLEKACIAGDTQSVILLARMYIRGVGVEIDRKKAIEIYERAFLGKKGWRIESELANEYLSLNVAGLYDDERAFRFLYDYKNKESCKRKVEIRRKLEKMLIMREVEWTVDYHCWWLYYLKDVKKIVLLLSISKFRGESFGNKIENRGVLIKGLVMKYIKYFFQSAAICCY